MYKKLLNVIVKLTEKVAMLADNQMRIYEKGVRAGNEALHAVLTIEQNLSEEEKKQARKNAGAVATVNGIAPDENGNVDIGPCEVHYHSYTWNPDTGTVDFDECDSYEQLCDSFNKAPWERHIARVYVSDWEQYYYMPMATFMTGDCQFEFSCYCEGRHTTLVVSLSGVRVLQD